MTRNIELVFRDGVFVPVQPLALPTGTKLRITIEGHDDILPAASPPEAASPTAERAAPYTVATPEAPGEATPAAPTPVVLPPPPGAPAPGAPAPTPAPVTLATPVAPAPAPVVTNGAPSPSLTSRVRSLRLGWGAGLAALIVLVTLVVFALLNDPQRGPALLSPLWAPIRGLREAIRGSLPRLTWLTIGGGAIIAVAWLATRRRAGLAAALVTLSIALALSGEMFMLQQQKMPQAGLAFAGAAVLVLAGLWAGGRRLAASLEPTPWNRWREGLALLLVMAAIFVTHFYLIGRYPVGVEGDESGWQYLVVTNSDRGQAPPVYPFNRIPTSYWLQSLSYAFGGTSVMAARTGVAILSFFATLLFYFAVREMINIPLALLATWLMGISLVDLAASRDAHVEAYVKIFALGAVSAMFLGYRRGGPWWRQPLFFLLSGVSLALGWMVYDSFAFVPAPLVAYALYRLVVKRKDWRRHAVSIAALALPLLLVWPQVNAHLQGRRISQVAVLTANTGVMVDSMDKVAQILPRIPEVSTRFVQNFVDRMTVQMVPDVLMGRPGPMESVALVPFLFLGLFVALWYFRRRHIAFILFWLLIPALPSILVLGQASPRIFLPYWGAFMLLAALALWIAYTLYRDGLPRRLTWLAGLLLAVTVGLIGASNTYAYFNELTDPNERQMRREVGDLLLQRVQQGQMVYMPYLPMKSDFLLIEKLYQRVVARDWVPAGTEERAYRSLPYPDLLPAVLANPNPQGVAVLYDKTINPPEDRQKAVEAFARCFPQHTVQTGRFFDVYTVSAEGVAASPCYTNIKVTPTNPAGDQSLPSGNGVQLAWTQSKGQQTSFDVRVEKQNDQVVWTEAEDFPLGGGWDAQAILAPGFGGRGYLTDMTRSDQNGIKKAIAVPQAGTYEVWARTFRRRPDNSPVFLQFLDQSIEIGGPDDAWYNRWRWQSLGKFDFAAGSTEFTITRRFDVSKDPWQMLVDAVVLSRQSGFNPETMRDWEVAHDSGRVTSDRAGYTVPTPLGPGRYRWQVTVFDGDRLVNWDGTLGAKSEPVVFRVAGP